MQLREIVFLLESWAPPAYQENYDNSGLLTGFSNAEIHKVLVCLDCTEAVIEEAITENCQLVIAHHPIVFSGLKRLTGQNYVERVMIKAIKNDIAIYAMHTNLDNIHTGVNHAMAEKLGMIHCKVLSTKKNLLRKLVCYIPKDSMEKVSQAIFDAGAGHIGNYSHCGFATLGMGSFMGNEASRPSIGSPMTMEKVEEQRFETVFPAHMENKILKSMLAAHPYEEVAYDIYSIENVHSRVGSGLIGELNEAMHLDEFLTLVKEKFGTKTLKYSNLNKSIRRVALCGGSGSFLRFDAASAGADVYLTSDLKYHEWFDAEGLIGYIDIGHYESEQFTNELILNYLRKNALSLQSQISKVNTNPVNYL